MITNSRQQKTNKLDLYKDSRGAVFVIGVFMAAFAAGMLYYLVGIAESIIVQERMQDAADSAAFGAAVVRAKGMNILVLINLLMATLIAILILLRMLVTILKSAAVFAMALAWFTPGMAAIAGQLYAKAETVERIADGYDTTSEQILRGADTVSTTIRDWVPSVSNLKLSTIPQEHFAPAAQVGLEPGTLSLKPLPTYDGSYQKLCLKSGALAGAAVGHVVGKVIPFVGDSIRGFVTGLLEDMVVAYGRYYCGIDSNPPSVSRKMTEAIPAHTHPDFTLCENGNSHSCNKFGQFLTDLNEAYAASDGQCQSHDSDVEATCQNRKIDSRSECDPRTSDNEIDKWRTHTEVKDITYQNEGLNGGWVVFREVPVSESTGEPTENPCTDGMTSWNHGSDGPVCETEVSSLLTQASLRGSMVETIRVTQVTDVFECFAEVDKPITMQAGRPSSDRDIHYEEICDCTELGSERLQVRAVVWGNKDALLEDTRKRIKVANLRGEAAQKSEIVGVAESMGNISFAQAEFFVDDRKSGAGRHENMKEEWMWHMHWRARLRRTHGVSGTDECKEVNTAGQEECEIESGVTRVFVDILDRVDVAIH